VRVALSLALVLCASRVLAQAPTLLYVSDARPWDPMNGAAQIDWALALNVPIPATIATRIDGGAWVPSVPDCDVSGYNGLRWCHLMPPASLAVPGLHRVEIANGLDASPVLLLRTPDSQPTSCSFTSLSGVTSMQPAGTYMGAFRAIGTDALMDAFMKRNGQLRAWGWIVDWKPVAINGVAYGALGAWCLRP